MCHFPQIMSSKESWRFCELKRVRTQRENTERAHRESTQREHLGEQASRQALGLHLALEVLVSEVLG